MWIVAKRRNSIFRLQTPSNYLVNRENLSEERLAFFVGEPEDKLTVRLWLGISKTFPERWAKDNAVRPLTVGADVNGKTVCAPVANAPHPTNR